jgi:hypothetical protein
MIKKTRGKMDCNKQKKVKKTKKITATFVLQIH